MFSISAYKKASVYLCVLFLLNVSGCGFKLRGAYQLPEAMNITYIEAVSDSALVNDIKRNLRGSGVTLVEHVRPNVAVLKILGQTRSKRVVSVDERGRAREYTLIYTLRFSVKNIESSFSIEDASVSIERDFIFDVEDVLGNSRGEAELYEDMRNDLVRMLMLKLQSRVAG